MVQPHLLLRSLEQRKLFFSKGQILGDEGSARVKGHRMCVRKSAFYSGLRRGSNYCGAQLVPHEHTWVLERQDLLKIKDF